MLSNSEPSMDELNSLPFLDAVVQEILRLHTPVESASRMAMKDDILPLSKPCGTDIRGQLHDHLKYVLLTLVRTELHSPVSFDHQD